LPIAPSKINLIADLVRKKEIKHSLDILRFLPQKGSKILYKILQGMEKQINNQKSVNNLPALIFIQQILVGPGRMQKKISIRAKGRSDLEVRRSSYLMMKLEKKIITNGPKI
jgi:large subunit ribosomal protein L22